VGDKVSTVPCFSQTKYGVYGEWAVVPARALAKYPDNLSDIEAASIWMQYLTAYGALIELGGLTSEQTVLITAASSSVGFAAIQIARRQGAKVIATTRGDTKKQALLDAGAHHVVVTDSGDLVKEVMAATGGKGADLIFDAIAGPLLLKLARAAAYEASIFIYGALSLETTAFPLQLALKKGLTVKGYTMFQVTDDAARFARGKEYTYAGLKDGSLVPVIDKVFAFDQIVAAHRYMESNEQKGKIVIQVS
jgi:NADPH2:quinone reductase